MYILKPIYDYRLWGGTRLEGEYGADAVGLAHLYSVYSKDGVSNSTFCGTSLAEVFDKKKNMWGMGGFPAFPLTVALVDAEQDLSIQVHPAGIDDIKCESWYFLDAPRCGHIYNGCKASDTAELAHAVHNGDLMPFIDTAAIEPGDYIHIEPGTIHAITAGSFLYEIEYGSDTTYRLHDYGRTNDSGALRDLHIAEGLAAADIGKKSSPFHYEAGSSVDEVSFFTALHNNVRRYSNEREKPILVTSLDNQPRRIESVVVKRGMSILLEPGEVLPADIGKCMVAGIA